MRGKFGLTVLAFLVVSLLGIPALADNEGVIDHGIEGLDSNITDMAAKVLQVTMDEGDDEVPGWGCNPWSPDGKWIVYQAYGDGVEEWDEAELCKMKADGTGWVRLTNYERCDSHGSFIPDGTKIVFQRNILDDPGDHGEVWIMNADGTGPTSLTQAHGGPVSGPGTCENKPMVSPDGTMVAFHTCDEDIWVMGIDGSAPRTVSGALSGCSHQAWSADGQWLVFQAHDPDTGDARLYKGKADGTQVVRLSPANDDPAVTAVWDSWCDNWPTPSPDGNWIALHTEAFVTAEGDDHYLITIMDWDGNNRQVLAEQGGADGDPWNQVCAQTSWAPDSDWLSFRMENDDVGGTNIMAIQRSTLDVRQITEGYDDERHWWSPDGSRILFRSTCCTTRDGNDYGDDLETVILAPWFFTEAAGAGRYELAGGDAEDDENAAMGAAVGGAGDAQVFMMASYGANPTGADLSGAVGYWDLFVPTPGDHATSTMTAYLYLTAFDPGVTPFWYDPDIVAWVPASTFTLQAGPFVVGGTTFPGRIAVTIGAATQPSWDDLTGVILGGAAVAPPSADMNNDGRINVLDLRAFALLIGSCAGDPGYSLAADLNLDGCITYTDYRTWYFTIYKPSLVTDKCPSDPNKTVPGVCGCGVADTDTDGDKTLDCNDGCPSDPAKTSPGTCGCGVAETDTDGDGMADCNDGCPADPAKTAAGQCGCGVADTDTDNDGTADCNDACVNDPGKVAAGACGCGVADVDTDRDGTPDCNDACPFDARKTAAGLCGCGVMDTDTDGDGTADCVDGCPSDPAKTASGACGCGSPDTDTDGDGTANCKDLCPGDPDKSAPGACGCGVADTDTDGDGTPDCNDGCVNDPAKTAPGLCGCGVADTDTDSDGTPDCNDGCVDDPLKKAPGTCGCGVLDLDADSDGVADCNDGCPADPTKTAPGACGCGVADTDIDADGTADCNDACPNDPAKIAAGVCGCGIADTDTDSDGTPDCN
ncbi:MAG: hypothetical protein KKA60_04320, partial [Proteobacteria bacterium]|nr:hypothetical protein [Pseudomonadota bacterium]